MDVVMNQGPDLDEQERKQTAPAEEGKLAEEPAPAETYSDDPWNEELSQSEEEEENPFIKFCQVVEELRNATSAIECGLASRADEISKAVEDKLARSDAGLPNEADPLLIGSALDSLLDDLSASFEREDGVTPSTPNSMEATTRASKPSEASCKAVEYGPRTRKPVRKRVLQVSPIVAFSYHEGAEIPLSPSVVDHPGWFPVPMPPTASESGSPAGGTSAPTPARRGHERRLAKSAPVSKWKKRDTPDPEWLADFGALEALAASLPVSDDEDGNFPENSLPLGECFPCAESLQDDTEVECPENGLLSSTQDGPRPEETAEGD
jgi:hypothetical protein